MFRVQVGAFSSRANAEQLLGELKTAGFNGIIIEDGLHRVQVGAFSSRSNAESLQADLAREGYSGIIVHGHVPSP